MITFLASLIASPRFRAMSLYLGLALMVLLGLRWYSNKAYSDGRTAGVKAALSESIETSSQQWKADLEKSQQQLETATQVSILAATAARSASQKAETIALESAASRLAIQKQVAVLPSDSLLSELATNDPSLLGRSEDIDTLQRALLESQLTTKELLDESHKLQAALQEYKTATQAQIAGLQDQLTATQGQLKVMTTERDSYKASFESATKKRGCGVFKKIVTIGMCR